MQNKKPLKTPSGNIFVNETGSGQPVLLVHGLFASGTTYTDLEDRVPEGLRLLNIDLPDHGRSTSSDIFKPSWDTFAQAVIQTADELELPSFHLVGHSMGGGIAAIVAALNPDRVEKLVLIDAVTFPFPVPLKGRLPLVPVFGELLFKLYPRKMFIDYFANDVYADREQMDSDKISKMYEDFDRNRSAALKSLRATANPGPVAKRVPLIKASTLAIWGKEDTLVPTWVGEKLASTNSNIVFEMIEGSAHSPVEEQPDATCRAIFDFLLS